MRVVVDTNVVISAVLFGGIPQTILEAATEGRFQLCLSGPMAEELRTVLQRPKFGLTPEMTQAVMSEITQLAEWISPTAHTQLISNDPDDNRVVDCAIEARADFIVSGDKHLLDLGTCGNTRIVKPEAFSKILGTGAK